MKVNVEFAQSLPWREFPALYWVEKYNLIVLMYSNTRGIVLDAGTAKYEFTHYSETWAIGDSNESLKPFHGKVTLEN